MSFEVEHLGKSSNAPDEPSVARTTQVEAVAQVETGEGPEPA